MFFDLFKRTPALLENYLDYCRISDFIYNKSKFKNISYISPTTLLPLVLKHNIEEFDCLPKSDWTDYLKFITSASGKISKGNFTYFPPISLPEDETEYSKEMDRLFVFHKNGVEYGGENLFKYIIGELSDNIYQHSKFKQAMVFAQKYPKKGYVEMCIIDNGVGIPSALKNFGLIFKNDCEAIYFATKGLSSKNESDRGNGLNSCISSYCGKTDSNFLIVSGNGAVYIDKCLQAKLFTLPDLYKLSGTLISFKIPYPCEEINIFEGGVLEKAVY